MIKQQLVDRPYRPSERVVSRVAAIILVILLFGAGTWAGISAVGLLSPSFAGLDHVEHASGTIVVVGPDQRFTLKTAAGTVLRFRCKSGCQASFAHLWRHLRERAQTDVYYIEAAHQPLQALYAD